MIFEMRANSKYQLGFPRISEKNGQEGEDGSISLLPQYSPYIVVDHKHGQLLKDAEQEHSDKQLPSGWCEFSLGKIAIRCSCFSFVSFDYCNILN